MSNLTKEKLAELTDAINARLAEFNDDGTIVPAFDQLSRGLVRLVYDVIEPVAGTAILSDKLDVYQMGYDRGFAHGRQAEREDWQNNVQPQLETLHELVRRHAEREAEPRIGWQLYTDPDTGRVRELGPHEKMPANGNGAHHVDPADPADLADAWPPLPDIEGGVDRFAQHPVAGEPEPTLSATAAATLGPEHTVVTPLRDKLPDPDVARERVASAIANGSGALVEAIKRPRTLEEVDADADEPREWNGKVVPTRAQVIAELQRIAMGSVAPTQSAFNMAKPATWATAAAHTLRLGMSWKELAEQAGLKPARNLSQDV